MLSKYLKKFKKNNQVTLFHKIVEGSKFYNNKGKYLSLPNQILVAFIFLIDECSNLINKFFFIKFFCMFTNKITVKF